MKLLFDRIKQEPLAVLAIVVALLVPFVAQFYPSYADRMRAEEKASEEYSLECTDIRLESLKIVRNEDGGDHFTLQYPTTCTFSNNTREQVSVAKVGPKLLDRTIGYSMIGEPGPFPEMGIASDLSKLTGETLLLPKLLAPQEQLVYRSVVAIPVRQLFDAKDKTCKLANSASITPNDISVCDANGKVYPIGNFANLVRSFGFFDVDGYGQGVSLGDRTEVLFRSNQAITPISCAIQGAERSYLCSKERSVVLPNPYWTRKRSGAH